MRTFPVLIAASAALVLALTGCSVEPPAMPNDANHAPAECAPAPSGEQSDSVKVSGDFNTVTTAEFTPGLTLESTQRTIVTKGEGEEVQPGEKVSVNFTLFKAATGEKVYSTVDSGSGALILTVDAEQFIPGIVKSVECVPAGSRVVAVVPAADAFAEAGNEQIGVAPGENLVFVLDIGEIVPDAAWGEPQEVPAGLPTVELAKDGAPTVTMPKTDPPADLTIATLKAGDGAVVESGDTVTIQYQGSIWASGTVFDQSWGKGVASFSTDGVIEGFGKALVGQKVGSQVIAVIPPEQGYGSAGNEGAGIAGTDTLVFIIDILATS